MRKFRSENSRKKGHFFITLNLNKILLTFLHEIQFSVQKVDFWIWSIWKKIVQVLNYEKVLKVNFLGKYGLLAQCESLKFF